MDNRNPSDNNNATVIKPQTKGTEDSTDSAARAPADPNNHTVIKPETRVDTGQRHELTRIRHALHSTDNSTGFEKARHAANVALANNKIILNNRFVLDSIIGSGGMGAVYKARDLRKVEANDNNPYVAVKVLNEDFQKHPDAFITLQREASKSTTLAHPNIVTVHDFDRDGAVIYMTMELLQGMDLESYVKSHAGKPINTTHAIKIIKDYCTALIYAHKKNIIHSDLKPGNIFITKEGAKILDFGIARLSAETAKKDSFDAGSLGALTPAYASLEMLQGEPPDQSDDVYAAAVIAYELFTGKHPYDRKPADQALNEKLKPERISRLSKRQWRALESALILKRSERTPTVQQFLNQLTYVKRNILLKVAALVLLVATGVLSYYEFFVPNELSEVIETTLVKGTQCYDQMDYVCGMESAKAVLKLEPSSSSAKKLYELSHTAYLKVQEKKLFDAATACIERNDFDCARINLATLQQTVPQSPHINTVQSKIELRIAHNAASACFEERRYDCAIEQSNLILKIDPQNTFALDLAKRAQDIQTRQQIESTQNTKNYSQNMASAESCFNKKDYACSIRYAKQALTYKPRDINAETLYQKASYAEMQRQEAMHKAKNVLDQGLTCFRQKNYSCAIAKSESALEFVPDFQDAIKLKQAAQHEIAKLKNSISIQ